MVYIPDEILSELLQSYPELWALKQGVSRINWKVLGRGLADKLSERTGRLITVEDVRDKCKTVRNSLRRLDTSQGKVYANLFTYAWYADKLGLTNAVDKITSEMLSRGELPVEANVEVPVEANVEDLEDSLGFENDNNEESTTSAEAAQNSQNWKVARERAGYEIERADGTKYIAVHMYDYIHIIDVFHTKMKGSKQLYDLSMCKKLADRKATVWQHWRTRGAKMALGMRIALIDVMQYYTPAALAMLTIAKKKKSSIVLRQFGRTSSSPL
uniref:Uncharacterized protein n=1 Tax=Glossina austeni TaxID=7395 RepID=A0A1A9VX40_GLOAU